jgi:peptidoglycan/LPS O-acetylase OafA/YrhL
VNTTSREPGFRVDIQGLRALAVGAVLAFHAGLPFVPGGYVGVDVFFVISGFLITAHLLREHADRGRISLAGFYARRIRRILPAAVAVVVAALGAAVILLPQPRLAVVAGDAVASLLFVPNIRFAVVANDYLAGDTPSPFQHYWSLGVEEQFYLLWPALLIALLAIRRRAVLAVALAVVTAVSFAACQLTMSWDANWAFYGLHARAWEFGAGALVGVLLAGRRPDPERRLGAVLGWAGVAAIVGSAVLFTPETPFPGPWAIVPVLGTALVLAAPPFGERFGPGRVLGLRPLQFIGLISYSLYLVHWPALELTREALALERLQVRWGVVITLAVIPLAWLCWRFVERPFQATRTSGRARRTILVGAAAAALAAATAFGAGTVELRPLHSGQTAAGSTGATPVVPSDMVPSLAEAPDDRAEIYENGCHVLFRETAWKDCRFGVIGADVTVALFGDSHAGSWFPALDQIADTQGFELRVFTKSACPASTAAVILQGEPDVWCDEWRTGVISELTHSDIDLIVLADHFANDAPSNQPPRDWAASAAETIARLGDTAPVLVIADVPKFPRDPLACLARHLDDALACGYPADKVAADETNREVGDAVVAAGAAFIDFGDRLCFDGFCPLIIGNTLVYRDEDHITATFARSLVPELGDEIARLLAGGRSR